MQELTRALGRREVVAITLNTIFGAGIFGLPSALAAAAGPASLAVLTAAFVLIAGVALCAAEVASRFDATGGPVLYAREALGAFGAFTVGWLLYITRVSTFGAIAVVMLDYAGGLWPAMQAELPRALALCVFVFAIAALNLRGVAPGAGAGNVLVVAKLLPLLVLAPAGLLMMGWPAALPGPTPAVSELGGAFLLAFFACMGFENASVIAGELRNPRRDLPVGMLGGFALAGLLYAALLLTCQATVPDLAASKRPLADAARVLAGPLGATLIAATALLSCAGNLSTSILVTPRVLFALAEKGDLPSALARVAGYGRVPAVSIVLTAVLVCALTVSGTFVYLATVAVIARMLMYGSICLALPILRKRGPARFSLPGGTVIAAVSILACLAVLASASATALRTVALVLAAGYLVRWACRQLRARATVEDTPS